jgi:enediyne biosynthesis protein E4
MTKKMKPARDHSDDEERDDAMIGRALKGSLIAIALIGLTGGGLAYILSRPKPAPPVKETKMAPVQVREESKVEVPVAIFRDVTQEVGVAFKHNNGAKGQKLLPESMGGGCAVFDFDNDHDSDLLLVNSSNWPGDQQDDSTMVLYRNDGGRFVDVSKDSGLDVSMYGMGAAAGDFDNDGWVDVFISALGSDALFRNLGNGKFVNVTETAGVAGDDTSWSSGTGWFDFDNDSDLDLFVCNYVRWTREYDLAQNFQLVGGGRAYGRPQNFEGSYPYLYRNEGNGKFTDVSASAGVQIKNSITEVPLAKSLGLTFCDIDEDGYMDALVANDTVQNLLLKNNCNGTFAEMGVLSGIAFDTLGNARGAMGIDVTSLRSGKATAIAIGNFANEMTALYVSKRGSIQFVDEAISTGLGPATRLELTFSVFYFDYDLDGRPDLFCSNGHLEEDINRVQPSQHYEQPPQLFWNAGADQGTEFVRVDEVHCGPDLQKPLVGRGGAYSDFDGDGDLDVLVTTTGRTARLFRNDLSQKHHWLRIKLKGDGKRCNRDAIGATVEVRAGDLVMRQQVMPTRSYLSQVELPVTFGLGTAEKVDSIVVRWPNGQVQNLEPLAIDQMHIVDQPEN